MIARAYLLAIGIALGLAHTQRVRAEEAPDTSAEAEYREVVERAVAEFDLGHVVEARALFLRAHELWPSARTLRTLGMTAFELRMYPRALRELQAAIDDPRRPLPPEQRAQVEGLIAETQGYVGRYQLQLRPAGTELLVDGSRVSTHEPLVVGVGMHELLARAPGFVELRRELVVQGREDEPLLLQLSPVVPPSAAPDLQAAHEPQANYTPAIVAFGVAGAGIVVGTVSGLIAFSKKHDTDLTAGHRAADISTAAWITAGVAATVGVVWLLYEPTTRRDAQAARVWVGPGGAQARF